MTTQAELPLEKPAAKPELRSANPTSWDFLSGKADFVTDSGLPMSPHFAENMSAVYSCVQAISETLAVLPLRVYRSEGESVRNVEPSHPIARLFTREPNPRQTPFEFMEQMTAACLLRGNAFAEVVRDRRGAPTELWPLSPDNVSVLRITGSRKIAFQVSDPDTGGTRRLLADEILHLKDRSDDGVVGKSRLQRARETLGTANAAEKFAANAFRNGASLAGVLSHPGELGDAPSRRVQEQFQKMNTGVENAGRIAVLEEGMRFFPTSVSPADAEILASRRFGVEQIARLFRVPLPILGVQEGAAYNSTVELHRMFTTHAVLPWCRRWEAVLNSTLLSDEARRSVFCELDLDEITRSNWLERWQGYRIAREIGALSSNEIRQAERYNKRTDAGGDDYFAPLNMAPEQKGKPKED